MKLKKIMLIASLLGASFVGSAQETVTEYTFRPQWFIQGQFGGQETLGEAPFGKLFAPNAQITVGRKFNPFIGARIAVNAWESRASSKIFADRYQWKWKYVAPGADVMFDMTNILGGYSATRKVDVNLMLGIGANIGFDNKQANEIQAAYAKAHDGQQMLGYLWDGTKARLYGRAAVDFNYNFTQNLAVGIELQANMLNDKYNSKKAGNADWYFNGLVGIRYSFGPKYTKTTRTIPAPEPVIVEKVVEKIVEKVVEVPVGNKEVAEVQEEAPQLRRDIFFHISNFNIRPEEMKKVEEVAKFLKENPGTKVKIVGYADKGTGTMAINLRLSAQRAEAVKKALTKKFGIPADRMTIHSMGETEFQPYPDPVQNRVAICTVK